MNQYCYYLIPIFLFIFIMIKRHLLYTKWIKIVKSNCGQEFKFMNVIHSTNPELEELHLGHYILLSGDITIDLALYPVKREDGTFENFPRTVLLTEKLLVDAKQVIIREKGKRVYTKAELTREEMNQ